MALVMELSAPPNKPERMRLPPANSGDAALLESPANADHPPGSFGTTSRSFCSAPGSSDLVARPASTVAIEDSNPRETAASGSPSFCAICDVAPCSSVNNKELNIDSIALSFCFTPPTAETIFTTFDK
jgi:hypothetical protein